MADYNNEIEKYLRGELSPAEMHALEKRALHDPFLADALEGASQISPEQFQQDVDRLSKHLSERVKPQKIVPLWVKISRMAAIFLAVVLSTFVVLNIFKPDSPSKLALQEEKKPTHGSSDRTDSVVQEKNSEGNEELPSSKDDASQPASGPRETRASKSKTQTLDQALGEEQATLAKPQVEQDVVTEPEISKVIAEEVKKSIAQGAPPSADAPVAQRKMEVPDSTRSKALRKLQPSAVSKADQSDFRNVRIVKGQVTDVDDGKGIPGVNVTIKGTNIGTVTNAEGYYQISTDDTPKELVFSFIGYESTEINTQGNSVINAVLNQDVAQLSEVVVVGYAPYGEAKTDEKFSTFELAAPAGGRKAFKQYLEQNIRYPEQALANKIEGKVTVQFTVETSGRLSDFRVIKGIGYGCDEELIRLIKQGPQWAPTKRDTAPLRDRVKVRLKFSLPKK